MKRPAVLLAGAVALAALIVGGALLLPSPEPPPVDETTTILAPLRPASTSSKKTPAAAAPSTDENAAKALYDAASAPAALREVWLKYPSTSWGKKAEERFRAMDQAARATTDRGFEEARARAAALPPAEAVAAWKAYAEKAPPDAKAKAEAMAVETENRNRSAYNEAVGKARELADQHKYAEAALLFESLAKGSTEEVATRCAASAAQLRQAAEASKAGELALRREEAHQALREDVAPKALAALRARRYAEALDLLKDVPLLEAELKRERALVEHARAFWEAFLKAAAANSGQELQLRFAKGKPLSGKLTVQPDRATLETAEGPINVPLDQLSLDQVAAWTLGKTLASDDSASHLKAAMFYFAEGRDDLASTALATAKEKGADISSLEQAWREGFLRAALWSAAQPTKKVPGKP